MKKKFYILIVFLTLYVLFPYTANATCPQYITGHFNNSCQNLCNQIQGIVGGNHLVVSGYIPDKGPSGFCNCFFETLSSQGVPVGESLCQYKVYNYIDSQPLIHSPFGNAHEDFPYLLVKMFSLQGMPTLPDLLLQDVAVTVYSAYKFVLTGIAMILAMYFLAMAGGWALMSMPFSQLIRVLQQVTQGYFSIPLKAEVFSRAGATVLAIAFFLLPVPKTSPLLSGGSNGSSPSSGSPTSTGSPSTVTISGNKVGPSDINTPSPVPYSFSGVQVAAPLAIQMAAAFVNYGYADGEAVAYKIYDGLKSYFADRINLTVTYELESLTKERDAIRHQLQSINDAITTVTTNSSCPVKTCQAYAHYESGDNKPQDVANNKDCHILFKQFDVLCPTFFSYEQLDQSLLSKSPPNVGGYLTNMMNVANSVSGNMGILAPSVMPIAFVATALFGGSSIEVVPQLDKAKLMAEQDESMYDKFIDRIPGGVAMFGNMMNSLGGAVHQASQAVLGASSGAFSAYMGLGVQGASANIYSAKPPMSNSFAFFLGQALVSSSLPPGSMVSGAFNNIANTASNIIGSLALIGGGTLISATTTTAAMAVSVLLRGASFLLGLYIAYTVNNTALAIIPFIVIAFAIGLRFMGYLFDIMRFFLSIPFYAIFAITREPQRSLMYFVNAGKMVVYPIVLALASALGFFAFQLSVFLFFEIPYYIVEEVANAPGSNFTFFSSFMLGAISMALYITAKFIGTVLGFTVTFHFPEAALESIAALSTGIASSLSPQLSAARSALSRMTAGVV